MLIISILRKVVKPI